MKVHDTHVNTTQIEGISVKTYMVDAPTLLNASEETTFIYEIDGGELTYLRTASKIFSGNLTMIDSNMKYMLSEMLSYSYFENVKGCKEIIGWMEKENPLNIPRKGFYEYKFKEFLCANALGMDPGEYWYGIGNPYGIYGVARSNGDVDTFVVYDRDLFKQYLLDNTYFEGIPDIGNETIYTGDDGKLLMNLNLQIRFYNK